MQLPSLPRFTRAEMLFSVKCLASAVLSLYVASRLGLSRPFWAMMTSYVVASPLAGTVRSKALYRVLGTIVGCTATLLIVPALANAPELLTLALALWVGGCLYLSLLDRSPSSYVFMLAGYTAALIGFPNVQAPQTLFDNATLRVEEIIVGILCATVVHSIVFPKGLAPAVLGLLDGAMKHTRHWIQDLLVTADPPNSPDATSALASDKSKVASDITQLRLLSTHIPFDTTNLRWTAGAVSTMQDHIASLMPTVSAVEDRLVALEQAEGALAPDVVAMLARIREWLDAQDYKQLDPDRARQAAELRAEIHSFAMQRWDEQPSHWSRLLRVALATRLTELVDAWDACVRLRHDIDAGIGGAPITSRRLGNLSHRALHLDHGMAALSGLAAVLAICLCSAFWILTGWPTGSAAAMMAAIFCCFFATMDNPVPAIKGFLKYLLWSMPLSVVYVLILLPNVQDFGMLIAVCAPVCLVLGCYMARPQNMMAAMGILLGGFFGTLAMYDTGTVDLITFVNSMIGQIMGIVTAAVVTALVRSVGVSWAARRIQRANWRELSELAQPGASARQLDAYAVRMLDRIGLLAPRIAQAGGKIDGVANDQALRDLRVGADLASLQRQNIPMESTRIAGVLSDIGQFFERRSAGLADTALPPSILAHIDEVLDYAATRPESRPQWRAAVTALVGLRRNLFPAAPAALTIQSTAQTASAS
ncbi:FUSC family protein [Diaphorobacter sp. HDW4A]|uniref:FUSC family protein n=1 Tax=Diaphorobacter sp. HDW4A TaxID=2714924 RepID=UPI0014085022|nr:FUSC family protein [Diaphorobacter sp. HDW4A]QIL84116.1 FUSC family protein [Diaphorobacter sp. HDW4A]